MLARRLLQMLDELPVQAGIVQVTLDVGHLLRELLPRSLVDLVQIEFRRGVADEALQRLVKMIAPTLRSSLRQVHTDQREFLRQHLGVGEIVERRHNQALGQVTAGTEDHHGAGIGGTGLAPLRRRDHPGFPRCRDRLFVGHVLLRSLRRRRVRLRLCRLL